MRRIKKFSFMLVIMLGLLFNLSNANAAKTTTMYLIVNKSVDGYNEKYQYTKTGLLKKRMYGKGKSSERIVYKNGRIVKVIKGGKDVTISELWEYDKGKLTNKTIFHRYNLNGIVSQDFTYEKYIQQ